MVKVIGCWGAEPGYNAKDRAVSPWHTFPSLSPTCFWRSRWLCRMSREASGWSWQSAALCNYGLVRTVNLHCIMRSVYDRMFGDFPARNTVYIHRIFMVLANPIYAAWCRRGYAAWCRWGWVHVCSSPLGTVWPSYIFYSGDYHRQLHTIKRVYKHTTVPTVRVCVVGMEW
jgi:hypothetical protein